jgi:hypothetical protein
LDVLAQQLQLQAATRLAHKKTHVQPIFLAEQREQRLQGGACQHAARRGCLRDAASLHLLLVDHAFLEKTEGCN